MTYDNWKTRSPEDDAARFEPIRSSFECDECGKNFAIECRTWHGGVGGWELCPQCAHEAAEREAEGPDPMRGVEFPFAENH